MDLCAVALGFPKMTEVEEAYQMILKDLEGHKLQLVGNLFRDWL